MSDDDITFVGEHIGYGGQSAVPFGIRRADRRHHLYAIGKTGTGKTTLLERLITQDIGRYAQAEPLYRRALTIREKALGPEHPDVAQPLNNLALLYYATGRKEEAEPLYQARPRDQGEGLGPDHPDVAQSLNNLALLYYATGRKEEAEPLFKRAIAIGEKMLGPEHPDLATWLNNLAALYYATGRKEEAEPLLKRALTILEKSLPPDHLHQVQVRESYATSLDQLGRTNEASELRLQAEVVRQQREQSLDPLERCRRSSQLPKSEPTAPTGIIPIHGRLPLRKGFRRGWHSGLGCCHPFGLNDHRSLASMRSAGRLPIIFGPWPWEVTGSPTRSDRSCHPQRSPSQLVEAFQGRIDLIRPKPSIDLPENALAPPSSAQLTPPHGRSRHGSAGPRGSVPACSRPRPRRR